MTSAGIHELEKLLNISFNDSISDLHILRHPSLSINTDSTSDSTHSSKINANLKQTALSLIFSQYLDPLCIPNPNTSSNSNSSTSNLLPTSIDLYPSDCLYLLTSMINISQSLAFDATEIELLAERIQYLTHRNLLTEPVLYIHMPKTGGTGFGQWLEKHSGKKVLHFWVPDGLEKNMFDREHFPDAKRAGNRRRMKMIDIIPRRLIRDRRPVYQKLNKRKPISRTRKTRTSLRNKKKRTAYPQVVYGHLGYGFDALFLTPDEIQRLGNHSDHSFTWKPRVNFTYITILRNPMTRVPSHYYYQKKGYRDENHLWTVQRDLFGWIGWFEESEDCMAQFLSGCHQRAWFAKEYPSIFEPELKPWPRRTAKQSPNVFKGMKVTVDQYKIARRHLMEMPWVGLTEYMTESVEQLKVFWGIRSKEGDRKENVNHSKPKKPISQNIKDKIVKFNRYDLALWDLGYVLYLQQQLVIKYAWRVDIATKVEQSVHGIGKKKKFRGRARERKPRRL